ncbi:MAG: hypothetical protein COA44_09280 [Arcobacter sp.]|nr:MAG: hypothetical protein COA44_09280 [Arcobacter sp.]
MKKIILILTLLLITGLCANQDRNATLEGMKQESIQAYKNGQYTKVIEIESKAFKLGRKNSPNYIASMYRYKLLDHDKAIMWYKIGVEHNNSSSAYNLATLYQTYESFKLAEEYYLKSNKLGGKSAPYALGLLYKKKLKNYPKAIEWYKKAVDIGDANGAYALGILYRTEKRDYKEAEKWFIKALKMKHRNAPYNLARLYENDLKEYEKAIDVYKYFLVSHPNDKEVKETIKRLESL